MAASQAFPLAIPQAVRQDFPQPLAVTLGFALAPGLAFALARDPGLGLGSFGLFFVPLCLKRF